MATPHLLIVRFGNNDYAEYFRKACEDFLQAVVDGERGWSMERLQEMLANGGVAAVAQGIVLSAWGYSIVADGAYLLRSCRRTVKWDENGQLSEMLERAEDRRRFLFEDIRVEATSDEFEPKWENSEVCYIDFKTCEVHTQ